MRTKRWTASLQRLKGLVPLPEGSNMSHTVGKPSSCSMNLSNRIQHKIFSKQRPRLRERWWLAHVPRTTFYALTQFQVDPEWLKLLFILLIYSKVLYIKIQSCQNDYLQITFQKINKKYRKGAKWFIFQRCEYWFGIHLVKLLCCVVVVVVVYLLFYCHCSVPSKDSQQW